MSSPQAPEPVKLVVSIIADTRERIGMVIARIAGRYGRPDIIGSVMNFVETDYYAAEMGERLQRRLITFERLIAPDHLPDVKIFTNAVEQDLSQNGKRTANIDPGYLSRFHLVLATGKGFAHRPYLKKGIYADLTLVYRDSRFEPLEWTYPDYAKEMFIGFLDRARSKYIMQLKEEEMVR